MTVGHYDEEEFHKVTPENKGNRTPRWEAEPNYGLPRRLPPVAPGAPPRSTSPAAQAVARSPRAWMVCRS